MTSSWHHASIGLQKNAVCCPSFISLLVKHRLATQEKPVVTCVLFFCLCCSSSSGTDSSGVLTSLGVDTASIEWTAQPLWIVVNWSVFCLSFVTLRMTHQHHYVRRWRRESVAVLHWQSYLCTSYLPSVSLLVCGLLWLSGAHWLKWNGVTADSMVSQTLVWLWLCGVWGVHGCVVRDEGKRGRDVYTRWYKFVLVCMRFALCVDITCECSCACVLCVVRDRVREARNCVCVIALCTRVHVCMCVFEMYLHCVCPSLVNVATSCVVA